MKLSKAFITGCDVKTEWMLPWFVENFSKHNKTQLFIYDFGMSEDMISRYSSQVVNVSRKHKGWFNKPQCMFDAIRTLADKICWLDTDCEVLGPLDEIFDMIETNKLLMAEDKPWTTRTGDKWHNSGVVAFGSPIPYPLYEWVERTAKYPERGDQEVLHKWIGNNGILRMQCITDLPRRFNVLRLDHLDKTVPNDPLINHWTGKKGKDHIRSIM